MPPRLPYCGAPPVPNMIWSRWNLDPVLIAILIAVVLGYIWGAARLNRKIRVLGEGRQALFYCGWILASLAFVSPLCPLSVALFSARVGQHVILTMAAAPLIAAGMPAAALFALLPRRFENCADPLARSPLISAALFALFLWFWHTPYAYAETFTSFLMYWLMHLTLFGSAIWLWAGVINDRPAT